MSKAQQKRDAIDKEINNLINQFLSKHSSLNLEIHQSFVSSDHGVSVIVYCENSNSFFWIREINIWHAVAEDYISWPFPPKLGDPSWSIERYKKIPNREEFVDFVIEYEQLWNKKVKTYNEED